MVRMIAAWGSSGAGKTVLCLALASQLAALHKNTVIISTDSSTPSLPVFLPAEQLPPDASLGNLLFSPIKTVNALKGYIHIHPASDRIGFMGITSGETPISYKSFKRETMMALLRVLNDSPFDYIIFDCQANPVFDPMTQLALQTAEYPIRMLTPDVRGLEFERSQTAWMRGIADMRVDKQIRIISPVHSFSPLDRALSVAGQPEYILPFSTDVYSRSIAGQLIAGCRDRSGIEYDSRVRQLAERIISDEHNHGA